MDEIHSCNFCGRGIAVTPESSREHRIECRGFREWCELLERNEKFHADQRAEKSTVENGGGI